MNPEPRQRHVQCLSPAGFHKMAYVEWGDPDNPEVVVCVHGLTRVGRDFDLLAQRLASRRRVICPDVVGRGASDWLRNPGFYALPQYAADMASLIARLDVASLDWVGTSMGGLIGLLLAGQPEAPIRRLVLNDVGPKLDPAAVGRIAEYVGKPLHFANIEAAVDYVSTISAPFGLKTREAWRAITVPALRPDGDGWKMHYDPAIAVPLRASGPEALVAGEAVLWSLYDKITATTLLVRGAETDLLPAAAAQEMCSRGPRPRLVEFAGVGHAPMFMVEDQIQCLVDFLTGPVQART